MDELLKLGLKGRSEMASHCKPRILILVADDDEDDRLLVREALEEWNPRVDIHFAKDGQTLMDYLHSCNADGRNWERLCPDLILLDLNMPKKSGQEALMEIRADARLKSIPVVILSTSSDQFDINFCHAHGANSFISKPCNFQNFADKMKALCLYWFDTVSLPLMEPRANAGGSAVTRV